MNSNKKKCICHQFNGFKINKEQPMVISFNDFFFFEQYFTELITIKSIQRYLQKSQKNKYFYSFFIVYIYSDHFCKKSKKNIVIVNIQLQTIPTLVYDRVLQIQRSTNTKKMYIYIQRLLFLFALYNVKVPIVVGRSCS